MKTLLLLITLTLSAQALAATAYFTGRQEMVRTVTHQIAWRCEYRYVGQTFWKIYRDHCPMTIEIY